MKLDRLERIAFIQFILESLEKEEMAREEVPPLTKEQKSLIKQRIEAIKSGNVKTRSFQDVEENIKRRYGFDA